MFVTKYYILRLLSIEEREFRRRHPHQGPPFTFINMRPSLVARLISLPPDGARARSRLIRRRTPRVASCFSQSSPRSSRTCPQTRRSERKRRGPCRPPADGARCPPARGPRRAPRAAARPGTDARGRKKTSRAVRFRFRFRFRSPSPRRAASVPVPLVARVLFFFSPAATFRASATRARSAISRSRACSSNLAMASRSFGNRAAASRSAITASSRRRRSASRSRTKAAAAAGSGGGRRSPEAGLPVCVASATRICKPSQYGKRRPARSAGS